MFIKTRSIVLKTTKVSDSGAVINMFTEESGLQSFFVKGLQGKSSKFKSSYFQPLTILNIVFKDFKNNSLQTLSDIELGYNYKTVTTNVIKSTQLFFINELLYKVLKEEIPNPELFGWIINSLKWFDLSDSFFVNFHLIFMAQLTKFLGFFPVNNFQMSNFFDLQEGCFISQSPLHPNFVTGNIVSKISLILNFTFEESWKISISNNERKDILNILISYYDTHLPSLGKFKSIEVLTAFFN